MSKVSGKLKWIVLAVFVAAFVFLVARRISSSGEKIVQKQVMAIDSIRKIGRLEVFRFSNSSLYAYEKDGAERIAEYVGMGVYSVDLEQAEIILDAEDNYIRIEVPEVEMPQGAYMLVDVIDVHVFEKGKGSKDFGIDLYFESKKDAGIRLEDEARGNRSFIEKAERNARMIIERLVFKLTDLADPEIEVVFV